MEFKVVCDFFLIICMCVSVIILLSLCHGASCMQANDAEGQKNDPLKKEKEGKEI